MKEAVLAGIDTPGAHRQDRHVTGAFTLVNPKNWLVTPVEIAVQ